jgi:protein O-GlcNAc transferase
LAKISIDRALLKAKLHAKKGEIEEAKRLYQSVLQAFPKNVRAQRGLAGLIELRQEVINQLVALYNQGQLSAVVEQSQALIEQYPDAFIVWNLLGAAKQGLGRMDEAIVAYKRALILKPDFAEAYNNMGVILREQGKLDEAIAAYDRALSIKPDFAEAYNNMGVTLQEQGKLDEAIAAYNKALILKPDYADTYNNIGATLREQGRLGEAIAAYDRALSIKPGYVDAYNNMGNALKDQGKLEEAIAAYNKALILKPSNAEAYNNMGVTLQEQGKLDEAIAAYNKALILRPDYAKAYNNMGVTLQEQGKLDEAIAAYDRALSIKPDYADARSERLFQLGHICDWSAIEADRSYVAELGIIGASVAPFCFLPLEDAPERHRLRSELYAKETYTQRPLPAIAKPSRKPERLRIGYFSGDFRNHAMMHCMAQIFAVHDKSNFEIFAYSYGPDTQDKMRKKLMSDVDAFHDVREMSDVQIVDLARAENLSIAVDLQGYTKDTKTALFAYGLAPVQISYLGYPGTLGADFTDYIVSDPVVIPEEKRQCYSEHIFYLPYTYFPTDNTRAISKNIITREDMGLPNEGFVFCCFNNNYKISQKEFDIWMRLLGRVEDSVLWLLKSNKWAEQNLKREAEARGISAERLIFAEKVTQDEHLARQKLADLFLDTFNYNAHTTTSDALWAGLPVVTKLGEGFAARVAASLLTAIGLPELITESEEAYEALALALATDTNELAKIKSKLEANRLTQPLFDSEMYTRHLETGYQMAYDRYFNGQSPDTIIVAA